MPIVFKSNKKGDPPNRPYEGRHTGLPLHSPTMLIVMAMDTEVLPVRAIRRVVVAVAVFVVDSKDVPVLLFELTAAFGAYQAVDL